MKPVNLNALALSDASSDLVLNQLHAQESTSLESHLQALQDSLQSIPSRTDALKRANLELQIARTLVELQRGGEAWAIGRPAFDSLLAEEDFESAADLCEVLFRAEQPASLSALGQGIWLAVTYPIDPELSVELLTHVVEETPDDADGAAVAAATALFLVDLRAAAGRQREQLMFFAEQTLGQVARRHSGVMNQQSMDQWMDRLELREPDKFLVRLRNVVDVLVQDDWWFDRETLQARLP